MYLVCIRMSMHKIELYILLRIRIVCCTELQNVMLAIDPDIATCHLMMNSKYVIIIQCYILF